MLNDLDGVLLDLDDTLFDHRQAADAAAVEWAQSIGEWRGEVGPAQWWLALENEHFPRYARGELTLLEQRRVRVRAFSEALSHLDDDAVDAAFEQYLELYERHWRALPGAESLLHGLLEAGLRVGILTNGYPDQQLLKLTRIGLHRDEVPIFASAGLGVAKPSPRAFALACQGLGTRPERTVMIGDNYDFDIVAARTAGLHAVFFDRWSRGVEPGAPTTLDQVRARVLT